MRPKRGFDQVDRRQVVPADPGRGLRFAVVTEQFVGRRRRVDAPRGQCVLQIAPDQRVELQARVDVAVVDVEERRRDQRACDRVPLGMPSEGAVGRLLAPRRAHQHRLRRRRVA